MEQAKIDVIKFDNEDVIATSEPTYKHLVYGWVAVGGPTDNVIRLDPEGDGFTSAELTSASLAGYFDDIATANAAGYYIDDPLYVNHIYEYSTTSADGKWHFVECTNYDAGPTPRAGSHFTN